MKNILAINFSQSGQLTSIMLNVISPLKKEFNLEHIVYRDKNKFFFPWDKGAFFDAMPETVLNKGVELEPIVFQKQKYDLIILGYQPWFLSLSQPTTALFQLKEFQELMKDTPIITVIGARNMWINAQNDAKEFIKKAGGILIGNIPLIDRNSNLISAITIQYWVFTGRKDKMWGIFPLPGISDEDIKNAVIFGEILSNRLKNNNLLAIQEEFISKGEFDIKWTILFIESRAKRLFRIWANIITTKGTTTKKRKFWLNVYKYYLNFALFIVSPIILLIYAILFRPFKLQAERKKKYVTLHV
jgi:hypothetical protein